MSRKQIHPRRLGDDWRARVNPVYARYWRAQKANRALGEIRDETKRQRAVQQWEEMRIASRLLEEQRLASKESDFTRLSKLIFQPLDGEVWPWPARPELVGAYAVNPESESFFRMLVFLKYGITFREMVLALEKDPEVYRKWKLLHEDFYRLRTQRPPLRNLKLKFNLDHFQIIGEGLNFGLNKLNEWELAECLDDICPCSQRHSAQYLKKLRSQIIKACKSVIARSAQSTRIEQE